MTTQPVQPASAEFGGLLRRVHELGAATENVFERLYHSLYRRMYPTASAEVTARAALQRQLAERDLEIARLQRILASVQDGIVVQDVEGRIVLMNQAARDLLGSLKNFWSSKLGSRFAAFASVQNQRADALTPLGKPEQFELNNRVLGAQLGALTTARGERLGTVMILRDMTQETAIERVKSSFVAHISHELNTPMNVMRVASEMLLSQPEDAPPNRRMLELLSRNIDTLSRMISDLLDVSQISSGTFELHRNALNYETLIWDVLTSFKPEIDAAGLELLVMMHQSSDKQPIYADEIRLKWAIGHLVRNAIAYNQRDGRVMVAAGIDTDKQQVTLKIRDTGVGISDTDLPRIFEQFYRGDARTPAGKKVDPRGLGQGLYIARTVAEAHGGSLDVQTALGRGSTFTLIIPYINPRHLSAQNP